MLGQLLRFFGWLSALDISRKIEKGEVMSEPVEIDPIDLKREAAGMLFRSSQKSLGVKGISETLVHGIGCLKIRLDQRTAKNIFGTINIPVINSKETLTAKIIRKAPVSSTTLPRR